MRPNVMLASFAFLFLLFSAFTAPQAKAAPPTDACALLSKAQVSAAVGATMGEGSHPPGFTKMCTWTPSGGQNGTIQTVTLNLESADSYQTSKAMLEAVVSAPSNRSNKSGITMTPAPGIGDDAFFSNTGSYTKLVVKKGATVFQLVVYSRTSIEKKRDMEKALAAQVISKL
jgi:hypothetical protein